MYVLPPWESSETDPAKVWDFEENNSWLKKNLIHFKARNAMKNDRIIEFSLHMKVRNWSRPPSPPSQCWKLKCCQTHKFDHQHKIQHWSEGGRGSKSSQKLSHLCIFGAAWSAKVCRVILLKLAGSDFELSHTIFKCWQTHEIHQLKCRVESEKVQKDDEHEVLSDAIEQHKTS